MPVILEPRMAVFPVLIANIFGFVASVVSFVLWFPQARRTWQVRNDPEAMAGISAGTQWLLAFNALSWFIYAMLAEAWWSGVPGLVNLPLAIATLLLVYRGRRQNNYPQESRPVGAAPRLEGVSAS